MTLNLTSDNLESHIVVNVSSTLTNTTIWFVTALCFVVDVQTYGRTYIHMYTYGRTDGRTDIFTGFIWSSLKAIIDSRLHPRCTTHYEYFLVVFVVEQNLAESRLICLNLGCYA